MKTHTGGLKEIGYAKPSPDPEFDARIEKAYEDARKRNIRNNKIIIGIVLAIIIGLNLWIFYLKNKPS